MKAAIKSEKNLLGALTEEQSEAVQHTNGPLVVIAGPGSGKTRVITCRIAWLHLEREVPLENILAVTFTRKAAGEMATRVAGLVGSKFNPSISTFHSFGASVLRRHYDLAGLNSRITVFDASDQIKLVRRIIKERNFDTKISPHKALEFISRHKNNEESPEQAALQAELSHEERFASVYKHYEHALAKANGVDFDDLLLKPVQIFSKHAEVAAEYQQQFSYVLIDEFQDTNKLQLKLSRYVTNRERNICVVGDPNQSIYEWRYADVNNILNFTRYFIGAKKVYLSQSFRSTNKILRAANEIIGKNKTTLASKMWSELGEGNNLRFQATDTDDNEAEFVVDEIGNLIKQQGYKPSEIAVMYRVAAQSRNFETHLAERGIPFDLVGGVAFFERAEVKDIMAYLHLINNPHNDVALERIINVPTRRIGARKVAQLADLAAKQDMSYYDTLVGLKNNTIPPSGIDDTARRALVAFIELILNLQERSKELSLSKLLIHIYDKIEYGEFLEQKPLTAAEKKDNVQELIGLAYSYEDAEMSKQETLDKFLTDLAVNESHSKSSKSAGGTVSLTTIHKAKGLEYDVVFVTGLEDGLLPHYRASEAEERRLCYVAITRAKKLVYLTASERRTLRSDGAIPKISQFITDIPAELMSSTVPTRRGGRAAAVSDSSVDNYTIKRKVVTREAAEQPAAAINHGLKVSDKVEHPTYGPGVVMSLQPQSDDTEIVIMFTGNLEKKKFMLGKSNLKKLSTTKTSKWRKGDSGSKNGEVEYEDAP